MRSMTIISLALLTGCATEADFAVLDDGSLLEDAQRITTRGDLTTDEPLTESPLTPVREPKGIAFGTIDGWVPPGKRPEALVELSCTDETCGSLLFDATMSENADFYSWKVNGTVVSSAEELVIVTAEPEPDVEDPTSLLEVQLTAIRGDYTDDYHLNIMRTVMAPNPPTGVEPEPPPPGTRPEDAVIVIGIRDCQLPIAVSSYSGCLTDGTDISHVTELYDGTTTTTGRLSYLANSNTINALGNASTAAWKLNSAQNDQAIGMNVNRYGGPLYPRLAPSGDNHLTSYYDMNPNIGTLSVRAHHFWGTPSATASLQTLYFSCVGGTPVAETGDGPGLLDGGGL